MKAKKINSINDLHEEKKLLKLQIDITEDLMYQTLQQSKGKLITAFTSSLLPTGNLNVIKSVSQLMDGNIHWLKKILPLLPLVFKFSRKLVTGQKKKSLAPKIRLTSSKAS